MGYDELWRRYRNTRQLYWSNCPVNSSANCWNSDIRGRLVFSLIMSVTGYLWTFWQTVDILLNINESQYLGSWFSFQVSCWIFIISCPGYNRYSWQENQNFARSWQKIQDPRNFFLLVSSYEKTDHWNLRRIKVINSQLTSQFWRKNSFSFKKP